MVPHRPFIRPQGCALLIGSLLGLLGPWFTLPSFGASPEPPLPDDTKIERLQRQLDAIDAELKALKGSPPTSPPPPQSQRPLPAVSAPPQPDAPSKPRAASIEQLAAEFRGQFEYVTARIGGLEQQLDRRVALSMYLTLEFEAFDRRSAEFAGAKMELFPSIRLTDRLRAFGEFEFNSTVDSGTTTTERGEVELDQGWIEYVVNEAFKPRFGVVLVPFGRYNLEPFDPVQELSSRPIFTKKVIPTVWNEPAAGFTGRAVLGGGSRPGLLSDVVLEYQAFLMNGFDNNIADQQGLRDARGAFHRDNNSDKAVVGRLLTKVGRTVELGLSGYYGSYDNKGHKVRGVDVDVKVTKGAFELIAEVANFDLDPGGVSTSPENTNGKVPAYLRGGHIEGRYRFWPEWLNGTFLQRGFDDPKLTAVVRYGQAVIANADLGDNLANRESRLSLGVNYRPVPTVAFKGEYQFNRTQNEPLVNGNSNGVVLSVTGAF